MTVRQWFDVPSGIPVHHHCISRIEFSHDDKFWTDASAVEPDLVAFHPSLVMDWVHQELKTYLPEAEEKHGRREWMEGDVESFTPYRETAIPTSAAIPRKWELLKNQLRHGRWSMQCYALSSGRFLVIQILCYADKGQPNTVNNKSFVVCSSHDRPAEQPYHEMEVSV